MGKERVYQDDPLHADGATVGARPDAVGDGGWFLAEVLFGKGNPWVWCSECQRVWRFASLQLRWLVYFDEYGWYCPNAHEPKSAPMAYPLLPYARLREEMAPKWPEDPQEGSVLVIPRLPPPASQRVRELMRREQWVEARMLYEAEAKAGEEETDWGYRHAQNELRTDG
jgi:hypothetical protein